MVFDSRALLGISGKTAFITGAASGIGLATVELLLQCGMRVGLCDIDESALDAVQKRLEEGSPGAVKAFPCDVGDDADVRRAAADALRWAGEVHSLITCAGIVRRDGDDVYDRVFDVNVRGTLNTVGAFRESFRARQGGTVVLVGSITASQGWPGRTIYCASKGAVEAAMRALALEFAAFGARVNAVAPGLCWTPLMKDVVRSDPNPEAAFRFRALQQALGAMLRPEEVARHILFLASELSAGIIGSTLDASGGRLAGHVPDPANPGPHYAGTWEAAKAELVE